MGIKSSVGTLKGLGPKKTQALEKLNIYTVEDLIRHFPKRYNDKRSPSAISALKIGEKAFVKAKAARVIRTGGYSKKSPIIVKVTDGAGSLDIVFFNSVYLANYFKVGLTYTFYGLVTKTSKGIVQMVQPDYELYEGAPYPGIEPVYSIGKGFSQKEFRKYQHSAATYYEEIPEWLPENIIAKNKLCNIEYALSNIHFPTDINAFKAARYRIIFEELFAFQLGLGIIKRQGLVKDQGVKLNEDRDEDDFINSLEFKLTPGQEQAWQEIRQDLEGQKAMNRLLQGDVGSGKTIIAEIAAFKSAKSGFQSVIMAPTEILAKQHFETFKKDFEGFGINVGLLCSSMKSKEKQETLEGLSNGTIHIVIGTHALIEDSVIFNNLGLVVTDEQHRFGVKQRMKLNEKGIGTNVLIMTATPIPRTLAVIIYGDVESSVIKTKPAGRLPIITQSYSSSKRDFVYSKVYEELLKGHQAYVISPIIEESESLDALSAEEIFEELKKRFSKNKVGLLHGNMSNEQKDQIMNEFLNKEIDILVSTVVVEVGVNLPNATAIVIENCERFGLAQLHQLRGRVGRSDKQSYCYLISKNQSEISKARSEIMVNTTDGFVIAEEDLKLRGPGDFFGTKQHGLPELKNADLVNHYSILETIKPQVKEILDEDDFLRKDKNLPLLEKVKEQFGEKINITI